MTGIRATLGNLWDIGVAVSILTNKSEDMSRRILAGLGVLDGFVDIIGGDTLSVRKPDPAGVFRLLARTNTSNDRAVIVGDSPVDAATGRASGVRFCGVAWGFNPEGLAAERAPVVESPEALRQFLLGSW